MPAVLLAALLSATPAAAWVIDLGTDGRPIPPIDGHPAISVTLPSSVLARQEPIRFLGSRGTSIRGVGDVQCTVHLGDGSGTLSPAYDQCARVYEGPPGAWTDLLVQVAPAPARVLRLLTPVPEDGGFVILDAQDHLVLPGVPDEATEASLFFSGRWWTASVEPRTGRLATEGPAAAAVDAWLRSPTDVMVVRVERADTTEVQWRLFPEDLPVALPRAELVALPGPEQEPASEWCRPELPPGQAGATWLYCLDATTLQVSTRRYLASGAVAEVNTRALPTGHFLEVIVRHPADQSVDIELLDGALVSRGEEVAAQQLVGLQDQLGQERVSTRRRFAPRDPGPLSLTVLANPQGTWLAREELEVVRRDGAAIRLGLGLTLPSSQEYHLAANPDDPSEGTVQRAGAEVLEGEIVVGIAPFLEAGGRDRMAPVPYRAAPFFGLGLLAASGADLRLSLLQSFWAGMEMEITPGFAVAGAFTLRRVQRLVDGTRIGNDLPLGEEIPTGLLFRPGLGVVLAFTPEGLRLPARGR